MLHQINGAIYYLGVSDRLTGNSQRGKLFTAVKSVICSRKIRKLKFCRFGSQKILQPFCVATRFNTVRAMNHVKCYKNQTDANLNIKNLLDSALQLKYTLDYITSIDLFMSTGASILIYLQFKSE